MSELAPDNFGALHLTLLSQAQRALCASNRLGQPFPDLGLQLAAARARPVREVEHASRAVGDEESIEVLAPVAANRTLGASQRYGSGPRSTWATTVT